MSINTYRSSSNNKNSAQKESERIRELLRYDILDTPDEEEFDDITKVAAYLCKAECAQINFLDYDRQWSKSCYGWKLKEIPRDQSICTYTIQQDKYLIINDVSKDPRFQNYDYVQKKELLFYAGVVLKGSKGYNIGTLCVFDKEPRGLTDEQLESLQILARDVETKLELRLKREELIEEHSKLIKTAIFLNNSADLMLVLEVDSLKIEEANKEVEELLGYKQKEIKGTRLTDYIQNNEFTKELEKWKENLSVKRFTSEVKFKTRQDEMLWLQLSVTEKNGKYFVTGRDITLRKKAQQKLIEQKKFTESIINHLPGIFFLIDEEGRIQQWNNNLKNTEKRTAEETVGRLYQEFIADNDREIARQAFQKAFKTGFSHVEIEFVLASGEIRPLLLEGFYYQFNDESYLVGIGIDITEEKQALKELEQKEKRLKEAQRIGRMGSWTWKIPEDELTWSDEYFEILGLDKENTEPTVELYFSLLPESEVKSLEELVDGIMEGRGMEDIEHQMLKSDGSVIYVYQRGETQYDSKGNVIRVDGIIQDVTDRKKAEEKIKKALKEKEVLLNEVHHRVKNNLAIINSLLQLETYYLEDERLKKILTESQMRINSMALIHEILYSFGDFTRISFKKYLEQLVQAVSEIFSSKFQHIDVVLESEELSLNINQAIPSGLIINELLTNALKHGFPDSERGKIRIELKEQDGVIHLCIEDNGVGIDSEVHLNNPDTLGFTLVNKLIDQLHGEIELNRENGTAFKIRFKKKEQKGSGANIFIPKGPLG